MTRRGIAIIFRLALLVVACSVFIPQTEAQSLGSAGTVTGIVTDPNSAVVPNATVKLENPVTGYTRTVNTSQDGAFRFNDVPPQNYQLTVAANGFGTAQQVVNVRTSVPIELKIGLSIGSLNESEVTVTDTLNVLE